MRILGLALGCLLAAGLAAKAADEPLMTVRVGEGPVAAPESLKACLEALVRYPSCFDAVAFAFKPAPAVADAFAKLGLKPVAAAARTASGFRFSDDHAPRGMIGAAFLFASGASPAVAVLDNGRLCASGKSAHGLCVESLLDLAYGATGLEYDLLTVAHEPAAWTANTYLSELTLWRPFYQAYVRYHAGTQPGGILPFCGKRGKPDLAGTLRAAVALAPAGLPLCPGSPWPVCYLVNAASVDSMTDADVQRVLSGGALFDGGAVARLQARGYGAALQVTAAPREAGMGEVFTDDELNVNLVNYAWCPDASVNETFALYPSNEAVRVIGRYQTKAGTSAEAASVLYETPMGGRLAVFGFDGFGAEISAARRRQLLLAADWVAQNRLPVFVETVCQAVVVPRVTLAGDLRSVMLLNATIDVQPPVTLRLRGCPEGMARMEWLVPKEKPVTVNVRWEGKDVLAVLPALAPWQVGWLRAAD